MEPLLSVVHPCCCGLDVHKKTLTACLLTVSGASTAVQREIRVFHTTLDQLHVLVAWLRQAGCRHVAMESTGVYGQPIYRLLQADGQEVLLVNAQHIKQLPGRKTDVKDAEWIATLLQVGLLRGSFVPEPAQEELRAVTRLRTQVLRARAAIVNRLHKLLERSGLKLSSVVTDILGVTGRAILAALAAGETDPTALAALARGTLRAKQAALATAWRGGLSETNRWLLTEELRQLADLDAAIGRLDAKVAELCLPHAQLLAILDQIPGIDVRAAEVIVAEVGGDVRRFPTAGHLASWAGLCPGQNESAGKSRSSKMRKGNVWLRAVLVEAGWAASHSKDTSLAAMYHRLAKRRGTKRACVAVGHRILRIVFSLLQQPRPYAEGGADYYRPTSAEHVKAKLVQRLQKLGYQVQLEPIAG
jgi:transposase